MNLQLILNAGAIDEAKIEAAAVHKLAGDPFTLIRAAEAKHVDPLPRFEGDSLTETMDVIALGFAPRGTTSVDTPVMQILEGKVTALARQAGSLHAIETDIEFDPGADGWPVVDTEGKLVGIRMLPDDGSPGIIYPVQRMTAFLERPVVIFENQPIAFADRHLETGFDIWLKHLPGFQSDVVFPVSFELEDELGGIRKFPALKLSDGRYHVLAKPTPDPDKITNRVLRADFNLGDRIHTGLIPNVPVMIGNFKTTLGSLARIAPKDGKHEIMAVNGKVAIAVIQGIEDVTIRLPDGDKNFDLRAADPLLIRGPELAPSEFTARVIVGGSSGIVTESQHTITLEDSPEVAVKLAETIRGFRPAPPPMAAMMRSDLLEIPLPGPVTHAELGGGGRYLVMTIPSVRQLLVYDLGTISMVGAIPLASGDAVVAAGRNAVVISYMSNQILAVHDLPSLERRSAGKPEFAYKIGPVAMGADAEHFLFYYGQYTEVIPDGANSRWTFVKVSDMTEIRTEDISSFYSSVGYREFGEVQLRASDDGSVYTAFGAGFGYSFLHSRPRRRNEADFLRS